jgi:hypothetical protein
MTVWQKIVIVVGETLCADARELERCLAGSEATIAPFQDLDWQDDHGNLYAAMAPLVRPEWIAAAGQILAHPEWGADMDAARRAQAALVVWAGEGQPPKADPSQLTVIVGMPLADAFTALGVQRRDPL